MSIPLVGVFNEMFYRHDPETVDAVKRITFEIADEHAPALRSAIDDARQQVGKQLEGMHRFAKETALTNASIALASLAAAVNQQVPKGDPNYA